MANLTWFHDPYDGTGAGYRQKVYNVADRLSENHKVSIYGRERFPFEEWMKYNIKGGTIPFEITDSLRKRRILKKEIQEADAILVYRWFAGRFDRRLIKMLSESDTRFVYDIDEIYWRSSDPAEYTKTYILEADAVVAASDILYDRISKLNDEVVKITDPVDTDQFEFQEASSDVPTITWVDRFLKIPEVCKEVRGALLTLQEEFDFQFQLIGVDKPEIRKMFDDVENCRIEGPLPPAEIPPIVKDSDIGLLPLDLGEFEAAKGGPTMLFEYMAAGAVPVSTAIGDPTSVINDGENGFLVEENNFWEEKLREALESDLASVSRQTREDVENNYSLNVAAEQYEEVLLGS